MYTKAKILDACKNLFFEQGIANTRLQQIADGVGISVGNLAYHFKNKEAIVEALYENLFSELSDILSRYISAPGFEGLDRQFTDLYIFNTHHSYTFNNLWEIARYYPDIESEWISLNSKINMQLKRRIESCTRAKLLKPEPIASAYDQLAQNLLILINSWIPQQMLRNKPVTEELYKRALWLTIYPYFTPEGISSYNEVIVKDKLS